MQESNCNRDLLKLLASMSLVELEEWYGVKIQDGESLLQVSMMITNECFEIKDGD